MLTSIGGVSSYHGPCLKCSQPYPAPLPGAPVDDGDGNFKGADFTLEDQEASSRELHNALAAQIRFANIYVTVILLCVCSLWVLWTVEVDYYTETAAARFLTLLSVRTSDRVFNDMFLSASIPKLLSVRYQTGILPLGSVESNNTVLLDRVMIGLSCIFKEVPYIMIGIEATGDFIGAYNCSTLAVRDASTNGDFISYGVGMNFQRNISHVGNNVGHYDARERPWYNDGRSLANVNGGVGRVYGSWVGTGTYTNYNSDKDEVLQVPSVIPAKLPDGGFVAVMGVDKLLDDLSDEIATNYNTVIGKAGRYFIVDEHSNLIGASHPTGVHLTSQREALTATDSVIQANSREILVESGTFAKAHGTMNVAASTMKMVLGVPMWGIVMSAAVWTQVILIDRNTLFEVPL
jgi:hypothetical protein